MKRICANCHFLCYKNPVLEISNIQMNSSIKKIPIDDEIRKSLIEKIKTKHTDFKLSAKFNRRQKKLAKTVLKHNPDSTIEDYISKFKVYCYFGVWPQEKILDSNIEVKEFIDLVTKTDRRSNCFFWKYKPDTSLSAGEILQKREFEINESKKDRRLTICALIIAALGLFNSIFGVLNFF